MITKDELVKIQSDGMVTRNELFKKFIDYIEPYIDEKLKEHYKNGTDNACCIKVEQFKTIVSNICKVDKIKFDENMYLWCIYRILDRYREYGIKCHTYTFRNERYLWFEI